MRLLALVLPLAPIPKATPFPRSRWPLHVTVLGNFTTPLADAELIDLVRPALAVAPVEGRVGRAAQFGPQRDIRVRLVDSAAAVALHAALLAAVRPAAEFEVPQHVGSGYRPHVTLPAGVSIRDDARVLLRDIALAEIRGDTAQVAWTRRLGTGN